MISICQKEPLADDLLLWKQEEFNSISGFSHIPQLGISNTERERKIISCQNFRSKFRSNHLSIKLKSLKVLGKNPTKTNKKPFLYIKQVQEALYTKKNINWHINSVVVPLCSKKGKSNKKNLESTWSAILSLSESNLWMYNHKPDIYDTYRAKYFKQMLKSNIFNYANWHHAKLPVAFVILLCLFIFCCMVCCKNCRYVVCALGCAGHPKQCLLLCLSFSFEAWVVSFPCVNLILNYSHRHWPLGWLLLTVYWPCLMYALMKSL